MLALVYGVRVALNTITLTPLLYIVESDIKHHNPNLITLLWYIVESGIKYYFQWFSSLGSSF